MRTRETALSVWFKLVDVRSIIKNHDHNTVDEDVTLVGSLRKCRILYCFVSTCTGWINSCVSLQVYISSSRHARRQSLFSAANSNRFRSMWERSRVQLSEITLPAHSVTLIMSAYQYFRTSPQCYSTIWCAVFRSNRFSMVLGPRPHLLETSLASSAKTFLAL